jgi:hypothetical protein
VQDLRFLEALLQKLGCCRSESKFVSSLLQEKLILLGFLVNISFLRLRKSLRQKSK